MSDAKPPNCLRAHMDRYNGAPHNEVPPIDILYGPEASVSQMLKCAEQAGEAACQFTCMRVYAGGGCLYLTKSEADNTVCLLDTAADER